ncbi:SDR family oxidoreductase [Sphingomonas abietis]|uniref:SDR family oxidoreductase n=1 Tax=Sphingomonas abietis TaxID=3012344 RepID=A0ABY7NWB6_9SPHN|nr:SDR family oxidoreductase [Sphingomonas abietis]WBO23721.1 SDR family oxidoreductase [Sphingomonas abietis]
MPTILITGCSSGFGLDTARLFADRGWDVVATMRSPKDDILPPSDRLRVVALDVTDAASIAAAIEAAGPIDALVNNAGIGFLNALEGTPMADARAIFETNTLGTIAMTQAVLPQFRARRAGVIVNVTSSVTLKTLPLLSVYTASKAAVNAFTDVIALELAPFNIRTRVVLPGRAPDTRFGENARTRMTGGFPEPYAEMVQQVFAGWEQDSGPITESGDVADAVWQAVTDEAAPAHIPAGRDAIAAAEAR